MRIKRLVPRRIEPAHAAGKVGAIPGLGLNVVGILRNTIVDPIESFDKFLKSGEHDAFAMQGAQERYSVQFQPEFFNFCIVRGELQLVGNDLPTEMSEES
jgi:hypothetical protein